jgi:UDP-N-acetylmuramoyl-L-alanyl-D-glutamate--2,6-diaminopimelate ligase
MKNLKDLLYKTGIEDVAGNTNRPISMISFNSKGLKADALFVAVKGVSTDGHLFIAQAIHGGASAIVCERMPEVLDPLITYIRVQDSRVALARVAASFHGSPAEKIDLIGITGTNGKTTTATILFSLFRSMGYNCGLISTVKNQINEQVIPSTHTTPDVIQLNALLAAMVDEGCSFCFMEVSSHALEQKRVFGLPFRVAVFTNITHDHLDYHVTFEAYINAKMKLFDSLDENATAIINLDDPNSRFMVQNTKAKVKTYAVNTAADYKCRLIENSFAGITMNLENRDVSFMLIGSFNASNIMAAYTTAVSLGENKLEVLRHLSGLPPVEGRFEYIRSEQKITGIVDYAHTPDALKNVLGTIQDIRKGVEQVITVVGCGGDRDAAKRPIMANIACKMSDKVILTSDNPRNEDPEMILQQMLSGVHGADKEKCLKISDRKEAIRTACMIANPGDIILIAGKGHEKYQEIKGVKNHFDDKEVLKEILESR